MSERKPPSSRDTRKERRLGRRAYVRAELRDALSSARREESHDPAFWRKVIHDIERAIANFER